MYFLSNYIPIYLSASLPVSLVNCGIIPKFYNGSSEILKFKLSDTSFTTILDNREEIPSPVYTDHLSKERSVILNIPIKYLYFDNYINPRPINTISIGKLSKEFYKGNPQLHLILARIDYTDSNKIKVFDGQHKAVAQLLLSNEKTKHLLIRLFISENNRDRLVETNKKAGKELAQVAFSANVVRQLQNAIFKEKLRQYLVEKNLPEDSPYTETMLLEYFKGYKNFKTVILDAARDEITHSPENSLKAYMSMEGKGKDLPLSYSSFTKSILTLMDPNFICSEDSNDEDNFRLLEINQLIRFCNIIGDVILNGKYNGEIGVSQLENKLIKKQADNISDCHLIACRLMREEILSAVIEYIRVFVIRPYLAMSNIKYEEKGLFRSKFSEQLWTNIAKALTNIKDLALWKNRELAETLFTGKQNRQYWTDILEKGGSSDGRSLIDAKTLKENLYS